jgi:diketogulonate reductase-like aldo/keto reductase
LNEKKLIQYAREEGIQVTSYSSFGASSYQEIGFTK